MDVIIFAVTIGIDEVGRGPLAGPVVVAAVFLPPRFKLARLLKRAKNPLRFNRRGKRFWMKDSKRLTLNQRLICYQTLKNHPKIKFSIAIVSPKIIDQINIAQAANLAVRRAYKNLSKKLLMLNVNCPVSNVLLDGGLRLPENISHRTIVRGDQKYNAIKLASIIAKITRDRIMNRLRKLYPQYGFEEHKGYGTKKHLAALKMHGPSPIHRLSFLKFI